MPPRNTAAKPRARKGLAQSRQESKPEEIPPAAEETTEEDVSSPQDEPAAPREEPKTESIPTPQSNISKKRKSPSSQVNNSTKKSKRPTKVARQGTRSSIRSSKTTTTSSSRPDPTPAQLITYLLSPSSLSPAYPEEELSFARAEKSSKTYALTSPHTFTPFQHLLCASLLSKPLSHRLGLRSIRTLLNPPFSLTSPAAITSAGEHQVWEALEAARTQHRQKTAAYIFKMGEMCQEGWGEEFDGLRKLGDVQAIMCEIKGKVKGMGGTGAELFLRRVQCCEGWEAVWPFVDGKALEAVRGMGLEDVKDAAALKEIVEDVVNGMKGKPEPKGLEGWDGTLSKEQKSRISFVVVLERALGASLEGNADEVRRAAMEL